MPRRSWPLLLAAALVARRIVAACSAATTTMPPAAPATTAAATSAGAATTVDGTHRHAASARPPPRGHDHATVADRRPASVVTDTEAVGGSTLSTVDLATGTATTLGAVGTEVGVLGIAVDADGTPRRRHGRARAPRPRSVGARRSRHADADRRRRRHAAGARHARPPTVRCSPSVTAARVVRRRPDTGAATPVAAVGLDDPGVGLDVTADGTLEVVVATGERFAVDPDTGDGRGPARRSPATRRHRGSSPSPTTPTAATASTPPPTSSWRSPTTAPSTRSARSGSTSPTARRSTSAATASPLLANPG